METRLSVTRSLRRSSRSSTSRSGQIRIGWPGASLRHISACDDIVVQYIATEHEKDVCAFAQVLANATWVRAAASWDHEACDARLGTGWQCGNSVLVSLCLNHGPSLTIHLHEDQGPAWSEF